MCGLAGFWDPTCDRFEPVIFAMTNALRHRGPDGAGYWLDGRCGVALGHRRLAVIDVSDRGRQPMFSASGRFAIVYNGEIYNFEALRREILRLRGGNYPFVGGSDTEVLLAAVEQWGVDRALRRMEGMFAFVLWDREKKTLYLVRDRLGIKPLYYATVGGAFIFGSELKALMAYPRFSPEVDRDALAQYLRYSSVPAPATIFEGVQKICPGEMITVTAPRDRERSAGVHRRQWWSASDVVVDGQKHPFAGDAEEAADFLEETLTRAVGARMIADVPLGAFLSGGIDSSTIVALMQKQSRRPVKTFSIGMASERYDEAHDAGLVAAHLGTDHTGLVVEPSDVLAVIPRLAELYDEPFADSSQLPTFMVSQLARKEVTVALSGDGGDELFGGYNRHLWGPRLWAAMRKIPRPFREALSRATTSVAPDRWDELFGVVDGFLPQAARVRMAGDKMHKMAAVFSASDKEELYRRLTSQWKDPASVVLRSVDRPREFGDGPPLGLAQQWMYRDLVGYLPDDILTKVDRASMGVALEARVPFLDQRVVSLAWRLPVKCKIRAGQGKWLLRQVLYRHVPRELVERPKMGFGVPMDAWLRGPLREWADALLEPYRLAREGFFDPEPVTKIWREHQSGRRNWAYLLWNVLVFQDWWQSQRRQMGLRNSMSRPQLRREGGMSP